MMSGMGKRISHDLTYDAPAATVRAMLMDPAFRDQVADATGCLRSSVDIQQDGDRAEVTFEQVQPTVGIPGFAKKLVGEEVVIVQRETWTSPTEADVDVTIPGKPGEMTGTCRLLESGGSTTERVELEINVRIPLVAGKIESLIADMLIKALKAENVAGRAYLSS